MILIVFCFVYTTGKIDPPPSQNDKFNFSVGFLNERLGLNFVNFSYIIYSKNNNDFFLSLGSMLLISNVGLGWKRYFDIKNKKRISPFISLSILKRWGTKLAVINDSSIREDDCINFSVGVSFYITQIKRTYTDLYFQIGAFASNDFRNKIQSYPFLNFEFRF